MKPGAPAIPVVGVRFWVAIKSSDGLRPCRPHGLEATPVASCSVTYRFPNADHSTHRHRRITVRHRPRLRSPPDAQLLIALTSTGSSNWLAANAPANISLL